MLRPKGQTALLDLMFGRGIRCFVSFDVLVAEGRDLRERSLVARRAKDDSPPSHADHRTFSSPTTWSRRAPAVDQVQSGSRGVTIERQYHTPNVPPTIIAIKTAIAIDHVRLTRMKWLFSV